jgi:hypothetical protein
MVTTDKLLVNIYTDWLKEYNWIKAMICHANQEDHDMAIIFSTLIIKYHILRSY